MKELNSSIIAVAIALSGFFIGRGVQKFNRPERTISVKGLAEKEVDANLAVWRISYKVSSDKIDEVRTQLPLVQTQIQAFLNKYEFDSNEISKSSKIQDRQAQEYGAEKGNRFIASGYYTVTSNKVSKVEEAEQNLDELLKKGIVVSDSNKNYLFTDLNSIKPAMLDAATQNAKEAADGFAKSMNVSVGKLKSAAQGVFSIDNAVGSPAGSTYSEMPTESLPRKKVRVVTQVEFYID